MNMLVGMVFHYFYRFKRVDIQDRKETIPISMEGIHGFMNKMNLWMQIIENVSFETSSTVLLLADGNKVVMDLKKSCS